MIAKLLDLDTLEAAIARRFPIVPDWHIFPVNGKLPARGLKWADAATNDVDARLELMKLEHDGWAVHAGKSGLFIVDLDVKPAQGIDGAQEWLQRVGLVPAMQGNTPSGGRHLYFPSPGPEYGPRVGVWPGVDVRAMTSYVAFVGPGRRVVRYADRLDEVPVQLLDTYRRPEPTYTAPAQLGRFEPNAKIRALQVACRNLAETGEGGRNSLLNWTAHKPGREALAAGVPRADVFAALMEAATKCGLDEFEATKTIESGLGR